MKEVYLNEYNVVMGNTVYFPLASGQLQAYAQTKNAIRVNYRFMPFIFIRDNPDRILAQYHNPAVAAFSCSMWNMNLSLEVAKRVKEKFPDCLVVFGGPSVPVNVSETFTFLCDHPFIDVTVRGEGERTFADLLEQSLRSRDFKWTKGISYRFEGAIYTNGDCLLEMNPDFLPSPYLGGLFDYLLPTGLDFSAIVETNRGCPYNCSFCFWGRGEPYRFFSLERVAQIAEWCGKNKIRYVFCADSNFGMLKRDYSMAECFVQAKARYGFPEKFRATFGKNAEKKVYKVAKLLHDHDMDKGITLSMQSSDPQTLANVGRKNIKLAVYKALQEKFSADHIPTYTELILGLPGETYKSFINGMEQTLQSGADQVFVHICQVYPNTKLAQKEYREKYWIRTVRLPLNETHASVRADEVQEYEEIVVATATMPERDWGAALVVSWVMQLLHGLRLAHHVLRYLVLHDIGYTDFFELALGLPWADQTTLLGSEIQKFSHLAECILAGKPRGVVMPEFGSLYWSPEEAAYLNILQEKDRFYEELHAFLKRFPWQYLGQDDNELSEVIARQKACVPDLSDYADKEAFAREVVLYGRKGGRMLKEVQWK